MCPSLDSRCVCTIQVHTPHLSPLRLCQSLQMAHEGEVTRCARDDSCPTSFALVSSVVKYLHKHSKPP
jgi:hypothetical protein